MQAVNNKKIDENFELKNNDHLSAKNVASTPMLQQYLEIKETVKEHLLFYRMGDFYELFYEDASTASKILDIALTRRLDKQVQVPMAGVPVSSLHNYLKRIIDSGLTVAICEQTQTPEAAKALNQKGPLKREVVRIITSGTIHDEELLFNEQICWLGAISYLKDSQIKGGAGTGGSGEGGSGAEICFAYADISVGKINYATFDNLNLVWEFIRIIKPKEILMCQNIWHSLPDDLKQTKIQIRVLADNLFALSSCTSALKTVYKIADLTIIGVKCGAQIQALGVICAYLYQTMKQDLMLNIPKPSHQTNNLKLNHQTIKNLEILKSNDDNPANSLFKTVDYTFTPMGKRLLIEHLIQPINDLIILNQRLDYIQFLINLSANQLAKLREVLSSVGDIERSLNRFKLNKFYSRDLNVIRNSLRATNLINKMLADCAHWPNIFSFDELNIILENCLIEQLPTNLNEGGFIKKTSNLELSRLSNLSLNLELELEKLEISYQNICGINNLKIKKNALIGAFIEIAASKATSLPIYFKLKQQLSSGVYRYVTPELVALEQSAEQAKMEVLQSEFDQLEQIRLNILEQADSISSYAHSLGLLDVALSWASYAKQYGHVRPQLTNDNSFNIVEGVNPILQKIMTHSHKKFTANNCNLSLTPFGLITAPNMAGKSTYLRQNALIMWLAHCGAYVPASCATIGLCDAIFTRIGAGDNLAEGKSTFMMEMIETASILHQASHKSFIILDEIGRGTATNDGLSIAFSVIEFLIRQLASRCLFATHYHELVGLTQTMHQAQQLQYLTLKTIEQNNKIVFLHDIIDGFSANSFGIHVARLAGIPSSILKSAEQYLQKFKDKALNYTEGDEVNGAADNKIEEFNTAAKIVDQKTILINEYFEFFNGLDVDQLTPLTALNIIGELKIKLQFIKKK